LHLKEINFNVVNVMRLTLFIPPSNFVMCTDAVVVRVLAVSITGHNWQHFLLEVWTCLINIKSFATYIWYKKST